MPGDLHRDFATAISLDQGQSQIDPRADAGRRPHRLLLHEDRFLVEFDLGVHALEPLGHHPMGRGAPAIEQTGLGQQESTAAH
ncbi:hypothetical protein D3C84_578200 [compost metagenome]